MGEAGKYLYGIIDSNGHSRHSLQDSEISDGVYTVTHGDISAVTSDAQVIDYTKLPKDAPIRLLLKHQQVIEKIMSLEYVVIPVRVGTFVADEAEIKAVLQKGYTLIKDVIDKTNGKIEIDIVANWSDFPSVLKEAGEDEEVKALKEKLLAKPEGISVDDQIKIGSMIKNVLNKKREDYGLLIENTLKDISHEFKAHGLLDDKMVVNTAFLIDKIRHREFDEKVEELNTHCAGKLCFRCIGPLPLYSFYTLEIKKLAFQEINWARKKLGLPCFSDKEEIKKAFRRAAFSLHPDKNPDIPDIKKGFDEINKAYKTLCEYCLAFEQAGRINGCSFQEEEYKKNALLVKLTD